MRGQFENWANQIAWRESVQDRQDMAALTELVQSTLQGQIHWAGSQRKRTAIVGSDLDMCITTSMAVSVNQRRQFARAITKELGRQAQPRNHVIRLAPRENSGPHIDLAFANAEFGDRPLPDAEEFTQLPRRQHAARALKWWLRSGGMPHVGGWAIEALVVSLDNNEASGWNVFLKVINWLGRPCTANEVESILKPRAQPCWVPAWSNRLPGRTAAIANQARRCIRTLPDNFTGVADIETWLRPNRA